ncbi:MAG TPA: amidohydrolase [Chloroflexota bacterium]|nr:amidohydrolase [Chloroflexota bacterium]
MSDRENLKTRAMAAVDARREQIVSIAQAILHNPELGFKEFETARLVGRSLDEARVAHRDGLAITGVKAILETGRPGPTLAIIGELDSIGAAGHPYANPETGAAHACGHHCQVAAMLGAGMGLLDAGVMDELAGRVVLFAVPAEEYVEIEARLELRRQGKLEFLAGKTELIRLGEFDDVDLAMMAHTTSLPEEKLLAIGGSTNGMLAKFIRYVGRAAHAGGAPDKGINALGAAHVALAAIHAQRETFRDDDHVRVHPIVTRGGDLVSVIPSDVRMETFVRASNAEALDDANRKVDRALHAGALAMGARLELTTMPGYMPLRNNEHMAALFRTNAEAIVGPENVGAPGHRSGGTDMGDLSHIMPVIHPFAGGAVGPAHGIEYLIQDYDLAAVNPAKAMAMTAVDLLIDEAAEARRILEEHEPPMTRDEYLAYARRLARAEIYEGAGQ